MDPIITPIVGIAASQTISGIANITTIAEGLLTFWSSIKGIVENNKSINDIIDKFINKAKQKVRNRDWLDQPIFISNAEVLENVLLKANNEKLSISGVKNIDVFNDIYDEIIYDKEFWEILQDLLTEHRLQIINNREKDIHDTSTAIQQKVDEVIAQIKTIVIAIEKANLSIDKLRPYYPFDKELFIYEEENRKLYRDKALIEKIHQNLDSKHVYLIQSSEGRGKTTLCRIIASDYYSQDTKVYFVDLKSDVEIDTIRKCCIELDKTKTKTLLVLENIHATGDLEALVSLINTYKADLRFLLNARPTESEYATYLKELGEDNIFDLRPLPEYCEGVARCLCKDKPISEGDLPSFISKKIYSKTNQKNAGANLRLLRIYCSVWNEGNYGSILDIREHDILEKFKSTYGLRTASRLEKNALLYLSCMYQFDVPLQEELLTDEDSDGLQGFYNKGLCTSFDGKFYLPHSVDAALLCKAICGYNQYIGKTSEMVKNKFINAILASSNPRKFEGDFKLLIQGLINREHEFRVLINELADWPMAEKIIRNINPGFVIQAFNTRNGHSSEEILEYYNVNIGWLKTSILELYPNQLNIINKRYLDIFKDIFEDTKDLENYLRNNDKIFCDNHILEAISGLGEEYKHVLIDYYEQNKDRLKSSFLELSPVQLLFIYRFFKSDLNIFKDIIKNLKDLYDYLKINDKVFHQAEFIEEISDLGEEYKRVLIDYFEHNIDRLKPSFLELSPVKLYFIYRYFNNYLKHNIFKDIFKDPKDLYDYLKTNEKAFNQNNVLEAVCGLGETYKSVLIDYYKQNTDRLKLSFLKINPVSLSYVYLFFIGHFNYNIIKDIFKDIKDLDDYLKTNCSRLNDIIIRAIGDLGDEYKLVLENYKVNRHGYNYFFSTPKNDYCISGQKIDYYKDSNTPFDITRFENNSFYFYKIDWYDLQRFVKIIHKNMNDDNRQRSIEMVDAIILIVLDKKHSLSYAKAGDLSYFYSNIASVDEELYEKLISNQAVIKDIKYRLSSQKFSLDDLRLFSHFYNEDWFYKNDMTKMVYKASESLNKADEKDLSTSLGSINYTNVNFYNDLITNEIVVGNAKKRFEVFTFSLDNLYLFGHFYSQDWCRRKMNELIDNADEKQQKVIKEWHNKVVAKLDDGVEIEHDSLLEYINNKFFNEQQNN